MEERFDYDGLLGVNSDLREQLADAQAQIEAVQAVIRQMGEQAAVLAKDGMAAKAQVEALQQERDKWKEAFERSCDDLSYLRSTLDAEREKVKALDAMYRQQLEGRDKRIENLAGSAKIWIEKLTQLKALVRAAVERWRAQTNVKEGISFRMAMKALEATMDATTPAGGGQNEKGVRDGASTTNTET